MWRMGEAYATTYSEDFDAVGERLIREDPHLYSRYVRDPAWMKLVFEDYQIILSHSVDHTRIIRTIAATQRTGRQRLREHRNKIEPGM